MTVTSIKYLIIIYTLILLITLYCAFRYKVFVSGSKPIKCFFAGMIIVNVTMIVFSDIRYAYIAKDNEAILENTERVELTSFGGKYYEYIGNTSHTMRVFVDGDPITTYDLPRTGTYLHHSEDSDAYYIRTVTENRISFIKDATIRYDVYLPE